ncbi:AI-2E family transporter [Quisquiliibacterium transsilvanicum]|uniref:Putative PurR-regulated permease PerM n=1 Tax=Quisquiliibacterium transsilvanicum TaxID=1549638 RepID=A0A7W8M7C0_9BURK|nr:putative PurR-regulated permease PerM [Quisquiliibacterium transsilvanicum]
MHQDQDNAAGGSPRTDGVSTLERRMLLALLPAVTLALVWILLPFYVPILWGTIIALIFAPLNRRLLLRFGRRRTLAALVTLLAVLLVAVVPFALVTASLAREAGGVYEKLQSGEWNPALELRRLFDALPGSVTVWLDRLGWGDFDTVQRQVTASLARATQFIAEQALGIGQNTFEFVTGLFITLYLAFFLIRDGERLASAARRTMPFAPAHQRELLGKFSTVIRATVKGNLVAAALQGLLGGLAFWALGVGAPLLWGVLMAFLSLVPAVGAALVWLPVALYFLLSGSILKGAILVAFGVLVIGLVDNLLRPVLVGKDTRLPDYVVLMTTLGGMAVLGINGFVLGPAIAAMFVALWHIQGKMQASDEQSESDGPVGS